MQAASSGAHGGAQSTAGWQEFVIPTLQHLAAAPPQTAPCPHAEQLTATRRAPGPWQHGLKALRQPPVLLQEVGAAPPVEHALPRVAQLQLQPRLRQQGRDGLELPGPHPVGAVDEQRLQRRGNSGCSGREAVVCGSWPWSTAECLAQRWVAGCLLRHECHSSCTSHAWGPCQLL